MKFSLLTKSLMEKFIFCAVYIQKCTLTLLTTFKVDGMVLKYKKYISRTEHDSSMKLKKLLNCVLKIIFSEVVIFKRKYALTLNGPIPDKVKKLS